MGQRFKVHEILGRDELDELESFAREPGRTIDECKQWLDERGFVVNRSSVGTWKASFDGEVAKERFARSGDLARAMRSAIDGGDFGAIADAAKLQLTQVVFEQAAQLQADGQIDPLDVQRMTRSLVNLVGSEIGLRKVLAEKFDREVKAASAKRPDGVITQEDIDSVRKAMFG